MPADNDICGKCRPPHAFREHDKKLKRGGIVKATQDKLLSGICLVAGCPCECFVHLVQPAPEKPAEPQHGHWYGF
jgi:hypothetical protein